MTHSGGQQHPVGDKGQRYEVTYAKVDGDGKRHVFGWAEAYAGAARLASSINLNPSMMLPEIRDRTTGVRWSIGEAK